MTVSLFSRLLSELKTDISPSGIQRQINTTPPKDRTTSQLWAVGMFWGGLAQSTLASNGTALNPVAVMTALGSHSEVSVDGDDFFI